MSLVTFVPAPGFSGEQGVVNAGGGIGFDVGAALAAGGGQIVVDDVASSILAGVLSRYPGLIVQGSSPGSQPNVDVISVVQAHSLRAGGSAAQVGDALVKGSDGLYLPAVPGGGGGSSVSSTQQAGNYTLALADAGTVVEGTSATAQTFTVPPHSSIAFPVGTVIEVFQYGAGTITIAAGAGVTLRSDGGKVTTAAQYATIGLRQRAQDEWVLSGDLA